MPKQVRHTVDKWLDPAAERTIKKMDTDNGPPNCKNSVRTCVQIRWGYIGWFITDNGKLVTNMNIGPRCLSLCSFAASEALVELAGYSPPVPKPTIPRDTVSIQNIPMIV